MTLWRPPARVGAPGARSRGGWLVATSFVRRGGGRVGGGMARSAGGVAVSLAGLLLLCFSAAPCDGGSRMVLNEETGAIEIISSPGVQQVGGTPRGKKTESQTPKGPDFGAVRQDTFQGVVLGPMAAQIRHYAKRPRLASVTARKEFPGSRHASLPGAQSNWML